MVRIVWLAAARNDLKEIYDYISFDSKRYAKFQVERIRSRTEALKKQIEIGKIVEEINDPKIREIVEGNYRIIYQIVSKEELQILMVHHGARDLTRRIKA